MKKFSAAILIAVLLLSGCSGKTDVSTAESSSEASTSSAASEVTEDTSVSSSKSAEPSETTEGLSDKLVPRDIIGDVNGDRYVSELGKVAYVIEGDAKFDGRNKLQATYGDIDLDCRIVDLEPKNVIAGQRIMWPDGSNITISFQYSPKVTADLQDKFVEDSIPGIKSTIESMQFTADQCEAAICSIGDKEYKAVKIKCHSDSMKLDQMMIYHFHDNGLITMVAATSTGGKYSVDQMLTNLEFQ